MINISSKKKDRIKTYFENSNSELDLRGNNSEIGITQYAYYIIDKVNIKPGFKYLDIGCGDGKIIKKIQEIVPNCEIDGIDISEKLINSAKLNNKQNNFFIGDATNYKINKQYHKIFSFSFLQYLSANEIIVMNRNLKNILINSKEKEIIHLSVPDVRLKNISGFIKLSKFKLGFLIPLFQIFRFFKTSVSYSNDGSIFHDPKKLAKLSNELFNCDVSNSDSYYRFDISFKIRS